MGVIIKKYVSLRSEPGPPAWLVSFLPFVSASLFLRLRSSRETRNEKRETDEAVCAAARYALTIRAIFLFRAKHPRFLNRSFSLSLSLSLEHAFPGSTWPPLRVCRGDDTTVRATVRHDNRRGIIVFAACHAAVTPARKLSHYSDGGRGVGGGNRNTTAAAAAARPVKNFKPTKL